jgi:hypothetical protein
MRCLSNFASMILLLPAAGFAQIHFSVQELNRSEHEFTHRITNESTRPIRAYTVGIDITYADGRSDHSEQSIRLQKPIAPGASYEMPYSGDIRRGQITKLELRPLVAIYADKSHEEVDAATYHRIADMEMAQIKACESAVNAIRRALADPSDQNPAATASAAIHKDLVDSLAATAGPHGIKRIVAGQPVQPDEYTMRESLAELDRITTREDLKKYFDKLQTELGGEQ